jgi:2-iminobutanoate/2-iminopropanoate deaminase
MLARYFMSCSLSLAAMSTFALSQSPSPNGVVTLNPRGAISTGTDTWSVGARAGDFIFVAGMQGVDPATNKLVEGDEARIRQAFLNLKLIAGSAGATLQDCVRLTVYVSDLHRFAPLVSKVQAELWGKPLIRRVPCSRSSASSTTISSRSTAFSTRRQRSESASVARIERSENPRRVCELERRGCPARGWDMRD